MTIAALKIADAAGHPDTGVFDADPVVAAGQFNLANRPSNKTIMTGSEIFNNIDTAEWTALTTENRQLVWNIVHLGDVNPFGIEATLITNVFGGGSTTITNLVAARKNLDISYAVEVGLGFVWPAQIRIARAYHG